MKEENNKKLWNFEIGSKEGMNFPIWFVIGLQQRDRQDLQNLNNGTFGRLTVTSAQSIIGSEKRPDSGILTKFDDDDYSQSYAQIKESFRFLTQDDILQPYISDEDFRPSNVRGDDVGYIL